MKFYLDALIDRHLVEAVGTETVEREEYHRKVNFPKKIGVCFINKGVGKEMGVLL